MAADASAYAVLGVEPGADWADIERAYKALIKRHHPDRSGGDAKRAAEIIHAYRELRRARDSKGALVLIEDAPVARRGHDLVWAALTLAAVGLLVFTIGPLQPPRVDRPAAAASEPTADPMDSDLNTAAIDGSVRAAVRIFRARDEMALADASRDCHNRLRAEPSVDRLDRCAAFDDAVVLLQDRDPLRSQAGPFSELAVMSRQLSAGTILSNDSLALDGRLDRIRLQVELALATLAPPPTPLTLPDEPGSDGN